MNKGKATNQNVAALVIFTTLLSLILNSGCSTNNELTTKQYYTWDGLEPDKWASVWLLENHVAQNTTVHIVPVGAERNDAIAVDTPNAVYKRQHGISTYESINRDFLGDDDPVLVAIGQLINNLEVNPWNITSPFVAVVEQQFRALQHRYDRTGVPSACYMEFFDRLYKSIKASGTKNSDVILDKLSPATICSISPDEVQQANSQQVFEYPVQHILQMIDAGKRVVFVDTREDEEFTVQHIPGSINIKLREVNKSVAASLQDADLVISYCVKDFRGYEVALALSRAGLRQSGIMKPYGIKGWMDAGLPVTGHAVTDELALARLRQCVADGSCLEAVAL